MRGTPQLGVFQRLDRLQRSAGGVLARLRDVHRTAHRAGGVDAGAAGLIREADEVRVGEALLQLRHVLALTVGQVEDGNRLHFNCGFFFRSCGQGVDVDAGVRHLAGGQHDEVDVHHRRIGVAQNQVVEFHRAGVACGHHFGHLALGEDDAFFLRAAVEILAVAGRAQVGVNDGGVDRRIGVLEVHRLLDAGVAAESRAVGQMLAGGVALTGTLHKHDRLHRRAIRRPADHAVARRSGRRQRFEPGLVDHVGRLAAAKLGQLVHVVQGESGRLHDGADVLGVRRARFGGNVDHEAARRAVGLGDGRVQIHLDVAVGLHLRNQVGHAGVGGRLERLVHRSALVELAGPAAQCAGFLDQHDRVAGLRGLDRGGHAGDAAADDQQGLAAAGVGVAGGRGHRLHFGAAHADVVFRHFLGGLARLVGVGTNPDHAFAQVGACHRMFRKVERLGLGAARAGADHDVGDALVGDVVPDHRHPVGVAQEFVRFRQRHLAVLLCDLDQRVGVETLAQSAALADIRCDFDVSHV